jgi:hypothetical protein
MAQIYSHAETQKIISLAYESYDLIIKLSAKKNLSENESRLKDSSIKYIRGLMTNHWFYGYLSEEQFKELSLI